MDIYIYPYIYFNNSHKQNGEFKNVKLDVYSDLYFLSKS